MNSHPDYNFENFTITDNVRQAYSLLFGLANDGNQALLFNPIYLYGASGTGKTHLMQAACHRLQKKYPRIVAVYESGASFAEKFIEAIRYDSMKEFREHYRCANILFLDDLDVFAGKEATQEAFLAAIKEFCDSGKQVVLSGHRLPQKIEGLDRRISSLISHGISVKIEMPDYKERLDILRAEAALKEFTVSLEALELIARKAKIGTGELINILRSEIWFQPLAYETDDNIVRAFLDNQPFVYGTDEDFVRAVLEERGIVI